MDSLTKLELPSSLKEIGESILWGDTQLTAVVSHIAEPFIVSDNTFCISLNWDEETQQYDYIPSPATLYVPAGTKTKYEAISGWTWFADIVEGNEESGITLIECKPHSNSWYNLQGMKVDKPQKGMYIRNGHKVVLK